jgi:hypothetical protein
VQIDDAVDGGSRVLDDEPGTVEGSADASGAARKISGSGLFVPRLIAEHDAVGRAVVEQFANGGSGHAASVLRGFG